MEFNNAKNMVEDYFNGQYEVKKFLGEGSFAEVYLVRHNFLEDLRAMKIVKQPLNSNFNKKEIFHEVMLTTQLRHENIISIYDAGVISHSNENKAYFVMEYVPGGDLEQYLNSFINSNLFMPLMHVLNLIKQILQGLNTLHSANPPIIHRDLKLNNILLSYNACGDIVIKISDFGFAKEVTTNISDIDVAGTRPYMAPECFDKVASTRTDVYAIGVIFYRLLTNNYPYDIDNFSVDELLSFKPWTEQLKAPSYFNKKVPKKLDDIVIRALDANPDNRYGNASELLEDVELLIDEIKSSQSYGEGKNIEYIDEYPDNLINDSLKKAFELAKCENKLNDAIEILEKEVLRDYDIRKYYGEILRIWKSKHPDVKLISKAFTVNLRGQNYVLACDFLKEAIAYNPSITAKYSYYLDLWDIFIDLGKYNNLIKAVISLEELMDSNKEIRDMYVNVINVLKTYSVEYIVSEAIRLANSNNLNDAAALMEFAVVCDGKIRREYGYKLSLWKQNMKLDFKSIKPISNAVNYAIDLGTTDSVMAYFNNGNPIIIKNHSTDDEFTPSAILINENNEILVGESARNAIINNSKDAATEFKHEMGFPIPFKFEKSRRVMFPEELSAEVLKDLRLSVFYQCGVNIEHAVICVPANSNPMGIRAINDAAELAGFKSHSLILEPIAAALAYDLNIKDKNEIWMIYDLGGGTFNVSIIRKENGEIEKLDTAGLDNIGGNVFDWKIVENIFAPQIASDLNLSDFRRNNPKYGEIFSRLKFVSEMAKKELSLSTATDISIPNLFTNYDFEYTLKRETVKEIIRPYVSHTLDLCDNLLNENKLSACDIDRIILVGGSCLSPIVKEFLAEEYAIPLEDSINPLTVVAKGASIYAGSLKKPQSDNNQNFSLILDSHENGIGGRLFSLDSNFVFIGFDMEVIGDNCSSGKIPINLDGTFDAFWDIKKGDNILISDDRGFVRLDRKFSSSDSDYDVNDLIVEYQTLLKTVDYLKDYNYFNDFDCLKYIERLIELSKIDNLALIPLKSSLNKLGNLTNEAQNELEFSLLLDNVKNKIRIARENQLFDVDGLELNEAIEYGDLNKLKDIYSKLIEEYVSLNKEEVIEACFFNLRYDGIYANQGHADDLIDDALIAINNSDYDGLFRIVEELYELDERPLSRNRH